MTMHQSSHPLVPLPAAAAAAAGAGQQGGSAAGAGVSSADRTGQGPPHVHDGGGPSAAGALTGRAESLTAGEAGRPSEVSEAEGARSLSAAQAAAAAAARRWGGGDAPGGAASSSSALGRAHASESAPATAESIVDVGDAMNPERTEGQRTNRDGGASGGDGTA